MVTGGRRLNAQCSTPYSAEYFAMERAFNTLLGNCSMVSVWLVGWLADGQSHRFCAMRLGAVI